MIAPALPDSLEALAGTMAPKGPVLLDKAALSRAGSRPGGLFSHAPIVADWSKLLDGVVIFPAEAAATDIRQPG